MIFLFKNNLLYLQPYKIQNLDGFFFIYEIKSVKKILIAILFVSCSNSLISQTKIRNLIFDRKEVFDSTQDDWFFAGNLANKFHCVTKEYLIRNELLFKEGEDLDLAKVDESERNLRSTRLFTKVKIEFDSISDGVYDAYVITQDQWSLKPAIAYGSGGGVSRLGGQVEESNLFGSGTKILTRALYKTENDIGWEGALSFSKSRLFSSEYNLNFSLLAHKFRTEEYLNFEKPFRTTFTSNAYGVSFQNVYGYDWKYQTYNADHPEQMNIHNRNVGLWYSIAFKNRGYDRDFISLYISAEDVNRGKKEYERAYDNSGRILFSFSSLGTRYTKINRVNGWDEEDMPLGGWGTVVLGKTFAIAHKGESLYYIGAQAEKSAFYFNKLYLFANLTSGSAFDEEAKYTYLEFLGLSFYRFNEWATLCARVRPQGAWSWDNKLRQLLVDNDAGLRGYKANNISGCNRIISNLEMRLFPDWGFWIFKLGGAAFYDVGATWAYGSKFLDSRFHNSAGLGLRFFNLKANSDKAIFRLDFAYNFDEKKVGLNFNTDQLFHSFANHSFQLPSIYGLEFDEE